MLLANVLGFCHAKMMKRFLNAILLVFLFFLILPFLSSYLTVSAQADTADPDYDEIHKKCVEVLKGEKPPEQLPEFCDKIGRAHV